MGTEPLDTRAALLEAAIAVIEESGEQGFRISAVLDRVGVASTAIYHHFGSRDDLVDSANAERYLRTLYVPDHPGLAVAIDRCTSIQEFDAVVRSAVGVGSTPGAVQRRRTRVAVLGSAVARPPLARKVHEANRTYARAMADAFRPAQERGWINPDLDLEAAAIWNIGQSTGRLMAELGGPVVDVENWALLEVEAIVAILKGT